MILSVKVDVDEAVLGAILKPYDLKVPEYGVSTFKLPTFDAPPRDGSWNIGLIVGPSGSGKTQLLKRNYGITESSSWNENKAIVTQMENGVNKLQAVGLSSAPSWVRPFHVLSNGEQFRANLARSLANDTTFDEFTSVVDRTVAKSTSHATQRFIRQSGLKGIVFASCHYDVAEWLQPDWIYDTMKEEFLPRGSLQRRPEIKIDIYRCDRSWWKVFEKHHYLSDVLGPGRNYLGLWDEKPVVFGAVIAMPGMIKDAWRGHRTVVLPDYQGLGIGVRFSDALAQMYVDEGKRYFSKTGHPRMGEYRMNSPLWKPTSKNRVKRTDVATHNAYRAEHGQFANGNIDRHHGYKPFEDARYSHEYIGVKNNLLTGSKSSDTVTFENG
jgi:GNAT superfamily N-acetyltransferase